MTVINTNILQYIGYLPSALAFYALIQGVRLSLKLKPGMICGATACCDSCQLLYVLEIGTMVLSATYIIAKVTGTIDSLSIESSLPIALISRSVLESAILGYLGFLCRRGLHCLNVHCDQCSKLRCENAKIH